MNNLCVLCIKYRINMLFLKDQIVKVGEQSYKIDAEMDTAEDTEVMAHKINSDGTDMTPPSGSESVLKSNITTAGGKRRRRGSKKGGASSSGSSSESKLSLFGVGGKKKSSKKGGASSSGSSSGSKSGLSLFGVGGKKSSKKGGKSQKGGKYGSSSGSVKAHSGSVSGGRRTRGKGRK
jgi:hypothetical protein